MNESLWWIFVNEEGQCILGTSNHFFLFRWPWCVPWIRKLNSFWFQNFLCAAKIEFTFCIIALLLPGNPITLPIWSSFIGYWISSHTWIFDELWTASNHVKQILYCAIDRFDWLWIFNFSATCTYMRTPGRLISTENGFVLAQSFAFEIILPGAQQNVFQLSVKSIWSSAVSTSENCTIGFPHPVYKISHHISWFPDPL